MTLKNVMGEMFTTRGISEEDAKKCVQWWFKHPTMTVDQIVEEWNSGRVED